MSGERADTTAGRGLTYPMAEALQAFARRAEEVLQSVTSSTDVEGDSFAIGDDEAQLRELRAAMPRRQLRIDEGLRIAERQAGLLRWQLGQATTAGLQTGAVTGLPFLTVTTRPGIAKSALATKTARGWVVVLREDEPLVRQRFSLCHELKHVLDDPFTDRHPTGLYPGYGSLSAEDAAERVCDRFAAALLMPKMLIRQDWTNRIQDPSKLARRYNVSRAAMEVRLRQLGLTEPVQRCGVDTDVSA